MSDVTIIKFLSSTPNYILKPQLPYFDINWKEGYLQTVSII